MTSQNVKKIVLLPGDGIGPEIVGVAVRVLKDCAAKFGHHFDFAEFPFGGCAIDAAGEPLPAETLAACKAADAILLGAVGGPKWDAQPIGKRPESGLLALRKELGPVHQSSAHRFAGVAARALRRCERIARKTCTSILCASWREIFISASITWRPIASGERAVDEAVYTTGEIERVAKYAFARAEARTGRLASVDKANVMSTSQLWRRTVTRMAAAHPGVKLEHLYVDNAAMQLVLAPAQFDVILTSNMFGDILSDLGAALVGSIGLIPSMSSGPGPSLYEPIHGSAPSLAGKDVACPVGTILSASHDAARKFWLEARSRMDRIGGGSPLREWNSHAGHRRAGHNPSRLQ